MPLAEATPNALTLTVSPDDTDDGLSLFVVGEDFPRVQITSAGVAVGDGTEAPTDVGTVLADFETRIAALE